MKDPLKKIAVWASLGMCMVSYTVLPVHATQQKPACMSSPLVITEVVPNTDNVNKADAYEYYELTNITDRPIAKGLYDITYINGEKRSDWTVEIDEVPAHSSFLVWIKNDGNKDLTKKDFVKYYQDKGFGNILEDRVAELACDGLSNSGIRTLEVSSHTGKVLTTASYNSKLSGGEKLDVDEAIAFRYDTDEASAVYDQTPTPLMTEGLVMGTYTFPKPVTDPGVEVNGNDHLEAGQNLVVEVTTTDLDLSHILNAYITKGEDTYAMWYEGEVLKGEIPAADLADLSDIAYTVTLTDGINTAVSSVHHVQIEGQEHPETSSVPALTITEILPDSANVGGADAYEFVEIANNSPRDIDLKDYKLMYVYPDSGSETAWWSTDEDKILAKGETLVFWIKSGPNDILTEADFNKKFAVDLPSDKLIPIACGGMANSGARGLKIVTNTGDVVDEVYYNMTTEDDTTADKTITYKNVYDAEKGGYHTTMTSNSAMPTPGTLTKTEQAEHIADPDISQDAPVLTVNTPITFTNETESLSFSVTAVSSDSTVKTVSLFLKDNNQTDYTQFKLKREGGTGDVFTKTLDRVDILNKQNFSYYFEASDGTHVAHTDAKTVANSDPELSPALNVKEGDVIGGSVQLIAKGNTLTVDGTDVTVDSVHSLNGPGKIAFDATDTDVFFKNAVAVNGKTVGVFNEGTYSDVRTYVYDIDASQYDPERKTITVEFHAGNKANALEHNIENNDDFTLRNIRMVLPNGRTLTPVSYTAKKGLGAVEHNGLDDQPTVNVHVPTQETDIAMGDGTSKYEILYAEFALTDSDFASMRYVWDTTKMGDGTHTVVAENASVSVTVDNTAPVITSNIEDGAQYHNGSITAEATDAGSGPLSVMATLDGKAITLPHPFRALEMTAGEHTLVLNARDMIGNIAERTITFTTPKESADLDDRIQPENGASVTGDPTLSVYPQDEAQDVMHVAFKQGECYELRDTNITTDRGISDKNGTIDNVFAEGSGNGFPYESFDISLDEDVTEDAVVEVQWTGASNNVKTFMYAYNTGTGSLEKLAAKQTVDGESMTLTAEVAIKDHLDAGKIHVIVQNGEGYTPPQQDEQASGYALPPINVTPDDVETHNQNDTPRTDYDFTFAVESDTQYYNEDYEDNPQQENTGRYQHQMNIHNWLLGNRKRMNIQYMFHDGDIIDDEPNTREWEQADAAYKKLDEAGLPYGVLAGNHDVGHLNGDYSNYSKYFGEARYKNDPWYGGSYKDNRGHYDLITVDGIDFIMMYMGWGIGDEEIKWMNDVLAQYPERKAILNFHEYLLASGGLGEEPQRIHDEVIAKNENVCMVLSGHYHNAKTRVDTFTNADGTERKVYEMLFDYQGLAEGGAGYMRLLHFDTDGQKIIVRTFTPSYGGTELDNYGDYDAKPSQQPNPGNEFNFADANLNDAETFEVPFKDLGIIPTVKTLHTNDLKVNVYEQTEIGSVNGVENGEEAAVTWHNAPDGVNGWYAEVTDANGGLSRTDVHYVNITHDVTAPVITFPDHTEITIDDVFDPMADVTAVDDVDGDITAELVVTGTVDTTTAGVYTLVYTVVDKAGNRTSVERSVKVGEGMILPPHQSELPHIDDTEHHTTKPSNHKDVATGDERDPLLYGALMAAALVVVLMGKKHS